MPISSPNYWPVYRGSGAAGRYWTPEALSFGSLHSTMTPVTNRMYLTPLWLPGDSMAVDQVGVYVNTAAGAGGVVRFGLYAAAEATGEATGSPTWESAALATTAAGNLYQALPAGTVVDSTPRWLAMVFQVAMPVVIGHNSGIGDSRFPHNGAAYPMFHRFQENVSGALPVVALSATVVVGAPGAVGAVLRIK